MRQPNHICKQSIDPLVHEARADDPGRIGSLSSARLAALRWLGAEALATTDALMQDGYLNPGLQGYWRRLSIGLHVVIVSESVYSLLTRAPPRGLEFYFDRM
jgi:hypothetical protein